MTVEYSIPAQLCRLRNGLIFDTRAGLFLHSLWLCKHKNKKKKHIDFMNFLVYLLYHT